MKRLLPILIVFGLLTHQKAFSQCAGQAIYNLDVNEATALLRSTGNYWFDGFNPGYLAPNNDKPPLAATIFAGGLWMGGTDASGNLKLSTVTFGAGADSPYQPGPLNINDGQPFASGCSDWDRFFMVSAQEVQQHLDDLADNGQIDGPVPARILGWPGRGNPWFQDIHGFSLPNTTQNLAPFWDGDGDGIYDPQAGDYPLIKGDEYVWWVYNDEDQPGEGVGMEVQAAAYAFNSSEEALRYTTFYENKLIYRGTEPLDSFYTSLWMDGDIGCSSDDYTGCLPDEQTFFYHNASDYDFDCNGLAGYDSILPVQVVKVLRSPKDPLPNDGHFDKFMYYASSTSPLPPFPPGEMTEPQNPPEFYNYMQGRWRDGSRLVFGGNGYNPASTEYRDYAFPNPPTLNGGWSMCETQRPLWDLRTVTSFGPWTLQPGSFQQLDFALVFRPDQGNCPELSDLPELLEEVEEAYQNGTVTSNKPLPAKEAGLRIYPNPTPGEWTLEASGEAILQHLRVYDSRGRLLREVPLGGADRRSFDWSDWSDGVYLLQVVLDNGQVAMKRIIKQ